MANLARLPAASFASADGAEQCGLRFVDCKALSKGRVMTSPDEFDRDGISTTPDGWIRMIRRGCPGQRIAKRPD
jgi:hypothetical protein